MCVNILVSLVRSNWLPTTWIQIPTLSQSVSSPGHLHFDLLCVNLPNPGLLIQLSLNFPEKPFVYIINTNNITVSEWLDVEFNENQISNQLRTKVSSFQYKYSCWSMLIYWGSMHSNVIIVKEWLCAIWL